MTPDRLLVIYPDGDYPTTPPLLIYSRWRLPYYTREAHAHFPQMDITPLHHPLLIYLRLRLPYYTTPCSFTPDSDYPTTQDRPSAHLPQMEIGLLHHPC